MRRLHHIELPYPPLSGNRAARTGQGRHYTPEALVKWRAQVRQIAMLAGLDTLAIDQPVRIVYLVQPPDRRARDADNVEKVTNDALVKAGVLKDDSNRVIRSHEFIWTDPGEGCVHVSLELLTSESV